jgi:hypothetical protein
MDGSAGLTTGGPVACRCGVTMKSIWSEEIQVGPPGQRIHAGDRYLYRCDGCGRRLRVEWFERALRAVGRRQMAEGSRQTADGSGANAE